MKISVISPVKNLEKYISETIESVINQRGDFEIEYLIIDGNSTDNNLMVCKNYQNQIENNTRAILCNSIKLFIISENDNNMYEALAKGLKMATGDIICYINGDDFYLPNAFSCVNQIFTEYKEVKWITGLPVRFSEQGNIINFHIPWQYNNNLILKGFYGKFLPFIQQESVFWRKELNEIVNLDKLKSFKLAGDYYLWHTFAKKGFHLFVVDSFLGGNRLRIGQLSNNKIEYFSEIKTIKTNPRIMELVVCYFYWIIEKFVTKKIKQNFSKNRLRFKKNEWKIQ